MMSKTLGELFTPRFDLRAESHWFALGVLLVVGAADIFFAWLGGNRSTLSRVFLDLESHQPTLALLMSYSAAVLVRHLCVPTFDPPPVLWISIVRALIAVAPILFLFILIAVTPPQDDTFLQRLAKYRYALDGMLIVGTVVGWIAASYLVPQHAVISG